MHFDLPDDHRLLQQTVRDFAVQEVAPVAEELDREKRFPYEIVAKMGELGWMGIPFPEEVGGAGGTTLQYALAVEELTRVDSSVAITMCAHTSLGTQPIYLFGSDEQKDALLPDSVLGRQARRLRPHRARGGLGRRQRAHPCRAGGRRVGRSTAPSSSSPTPAPTSPATSASPRGRATARSRTSWWRTARPATSRARPIARWAGTRSDTRPLTFTDCRVPEENLLGPRGQGFKQFLHILDIGRIGVAAMGVGLAQGALDEALAYAKERRAFGQPISKFQAIQGKLADMATEIEAARLLTYKAAFLKDEGRNFTLTAAQAKLKTGRLAVRCAEEAVQIHGGYGYIEEYPVCRFYRDAKILTIGEGTDEVQQMVIARALGA